MKAGVSILHKNNVEVKESTNNTLRFYQDLLNALNNLRTSNENN
jgi:hypothetical protein